MFSIFYLFYIQLPVFGADGNEGTERERLECALYIWFSVENIKMEKNV